MRQAGVTEAPARDRDRADVDFEVDESVAPAPVRSRRRRADSWIDDAELFGSHYDADPPPAPAARDDEYARESHHVAAAPAVDPADPHEQEDWDGIPDDVWGGFSPKRATRRESRPSRAPRPVRESRPASDGWSEPAPPRRAAPSRRAGGRSDSGYARLAATRPGCTVLVGDDAVPVSIDVLAHPAHAPAAPAPVAPSADSARVAGGGVPGRRTVTIRGRGAERDLAFPAPGQPRRPPVRRHERPGFKPDRTALWALLLGVVLVLVAATSSHAAALSHTTRAQARPAARVAHVAPRVTRAAVVALRSR